MQLVLSGNRVIAHGENFLSMGGVVINTETGEKYDSATVAECDGCPSDIDSVGYEYHSGVFIPCAPYGKGSGNGYFMEICECATPRNSGIPISILKECMRFELLWENASPDSDFAAQTIPLASDDWDFLICDAKNAACMVFANNAGSLVNVTLNNNTSFNVFARKLGATSKTEISIEACKAATATDGGDVSRSASNGSLIPYRIYGVRL